MCEGLLSLWQLNQCNALSFHPSMAAVRAAVAQTLFSAQRALRQHAVLATSHLVRCKLCSTPARPAVMSVPRSAARTLHQLGAPPSRTRAPMTCGGHLPTTYSRRASVPRHLHVQGRLVQGHRAFGPASEHVPPSAPALVTPLPCRKGVRGLCPPTGITYRKIPLLA